MLRRPRLRRVVLARYDAAGNSPTNRRHWANADGLSAVQANSPDVRARLRNRSRYERDNNPYVLGLALSLANDTQGTGPRLQVLTPDEELNQAVEQIWSAWAEACQLAAKLWTMTQAKIIDGEAFGLLITNRRLEHPVKLDLRLIEADQVATPANLAEASEWPDGIVLDRDGNPQAYYVLREHPGGGGFAQAFDRWPARYVIHWFRPDRPGQIRGVPELTAALSLGAQLRRWTQAALTAAEVAASFSGVLKSRTSPEDAEPPEPFDELEFEHGMFTTLPEGYDLQQLEPKQPSSNYDVFKHELLDEMGRCRCVPSLVMRGNAAHYNFSSARVDRIGYVKALEIDRRHCERVVLRPLLGEWLAEATRLPDFLPRGLSFTDLPHRWLWDGLDYIDPHKEAAADEIALANGFSTLAEICGKRGRYWADVLRQRARERELARRLGLDLDPQPAAVEEEVPDDADV